MAQKVVLIDDLDESEGAETIRYMVDGVEYEIDLSEKNAQEFRTALQKYINASRLVEAQTPAPVSVTRAGTRRRSSSSGGSRREDLAEIREWAKQQGEEVAPRGRIRKKIIEDYDRAHSSVGQ
jgi:hypothetical protein